MKKVRKDEEKRTSYNYWHADADCCNDGGIHFKDVKREGGKKMVVIEDEKLFDIIRTIIAEEIKKLAPAPIDDSAPMSVKGAADYLGVNVSTVYRMARSEGLPHAKLGGKILIYKRELDEYIGREGNEVVSN